jgi:non-specific serine/threonine protein kinase
LATPAVRRSNLPVPLTTLIDRSDEVADIGALLQRPSVRLLTLIGPGGVGKTRLALRIAQELEPHFADGVVFVDLAPIRDHTLVAKTIAQVIDARYSDTLPPEEALHNALHQRHHLLVIDNFEQVVEAAPLLPALLLACPRLTILVTSRKVLRVSGEHHYLVPPLAFPSTLAPSTSFEFSSFPAVQLFDNRAQAARPDFVLSERNAAAVAAIVQRLDGLPLAIELAAARSNALTPAVLLEQLESSLPLLTAGPIDAPHRLRTMRNAIAWSHDLLTPAERQLFRQLAVFVAGFDLEAAEMVATTGDDSVGILEGVLLLVDKSLLRSVETADGASRFVMLETVREFGLEQLAASGDEQALRRRHAEWFLTLAERANPAWLTADQGRWIRRLEVEQDNFRAALSWAMQEDGDAEIGIQLALLVSKFWLARGQIREGFQWLEQGLSREVSKRSRAQALVHFGLLTGYLGAASRAQEILEEGVRLCQETGDDEYLGGGLIMLGTMAEDRGDFARAVALLTEAVALHRARGDSKMAAYALQHLGLVTFGLGDLELASNQCEEALTLQRMLGNEYGAMASLVYLGLIACERGDYQQAFAYYEESLALAEKQRTFLTVERSLAGLASIASLLGAPDIAARLFGMADAIRTTLGTTFNLPERVQYDQARDSARALLGNDQFTATFTTGQSLDVNEMVAMGINDVRFLLAPAPSDATTHPNGLTEREVEILRLVSAGLTNKQIAAQLFLSPRTVNTHLVSIFGKIDVTSRAAATRFALDNGLA